VNRLLAEQAFQAGKAHVRANDMKAAAVELKKAAELFPQIEYELWAAWTAMRADKDGEAGHVAHVKQLAETAIEQDPSLGFAYFALGHLALRAFDANRAKELFAKARALDPAASTEAKDVRLKAKEKEAKAPSAPPPAPSPEEKKEEEKQVEPEAPVAAAPVPETAAPAPPSRTKVIAAVAAVAVIAIVAALISSRSSDAPKGTKTSQTATPAVDASAAPPDNKNAISLDDDDDAGTLNAAAIDASVGD